MEGLLQVNSSSSISPEPDDTVDGGDRVSHDSELAMAGVTLYQLIKDHFKGLIRLDCSEWEGGSLILNLFRLF